MRSFPIRSTLLAVATAFAAVPASALDLDWSGFGTIGWAQSNRDYVYERSVDSGGTVDRDSVLGLQLDARLSSQWSATLQLKTAQALDRDDAWELTPTWAFVGWRPSDDWLLRVGRLRLPLYLYSEQIDVGATHDMARLPTEMYAIAPSNEFDGGSATKTWILGDGELSLDAYAGSATTTARYASRDGAPPRRPAGANFVEVRARAVGLAMTLRQSDAVWRASVHRVRTTQTDGGRIPVTLERVCLAPGDAYCYYKVDDAMPGGGPVRTVSTITNYIVTLGLEQHLGADWRVAAEYARDLQRDTEFASNTSGGYVALSRDIGPVTPYLSVSQLRSTKGTRDWYRKLTGNPLPSSLPGADQLNAAQRLAAETIWAADQRSVALGAAWTPAPGSKLKLQWQRTRIGQMSRLVETPPGSETIRDTHLDVWSLNYSFVF